MSRHELLGALVATFCATSATACPWRVISMNQPFVLIGNPLTLAVIEFFGSRRAARVGCSIPFELDGWISSYLGAGIQVIMRSPAGSGTAPARIWPCRHSAPGRSSA